MAKPLNLGNTNKDLKEFNDIATSLNVTLQDIAKSMKENAKAASEFTGDSAEAYQEMFKESISLSKELQGFTKEQLKDGRTRTGFENKILKSKSNIVAIESKIRYLLEKKVNATKKEQIFIDRSLRSLKNSLTTIEANVEAADDLLETFKEIDKKTAWIDKMSDFVSDIPVVNKLFGEFSKASKTARDAAAEGKSQFGAIIDLLGSLSIKGLIGSALGVFTRVAHQAHSLSNSLNISKHEAADLTIEYSEMAKSSSELLMDSNDLVESQNKLSSALGVSARFSRETLESFDILTDRMGVSEDVASDLAQTVIATGGSFKEFSEDALGTVKVMNAIEGSAIQQQQIFGDIAATSNATRLSMRAQGNDLAKVAFQARKIGLTLQQQEKIQSNLLDFESSIEAELQAELLTNKELNLEAARLAALKGDQASLTAEIAKNIGTAEDFGKMNLLQQEAIAKVFGMQREDFADMLVKQEALGKLSAKNETEAIKKIRERIAQGESYNDIVKDIGSTELVDRAQNISLQEKMNKLLTKATDVLLSEHMVSFFKTIDGLLKSAVIHADKIGVAMGVIGSFFIGGKIIRGIGLLVKALRWISTTARGITQMFGKLKFLSAGGKITGKETVGGQTMLKHAPQTGKMAGKMAGKGLSRLVPGLGTAMGAGLAIQDLMEGDYWGAGLNAGASIASLFPGAGTAIAGGLVAADIGRELLSPVDDYIMSKGKITPINSNDTNIGFKPDGPIANANSNLISELKTSNKLLMQILQNSSTPIVLEMDGNKVGQSLNIAEHNLQ